MPWGKCFFRPGKAGVWRVILALIKAVVISLRGLARGGLPPQTAPGLNSVEPPRKYRAERAPGAAFTATGRERDTRTRVGQRRREERIMGDLFIPVAGRHGAEEQRRNSEREKRPGSCAESGR